MTRMCEQKPRAFTDEYIGPLRPIVMLSSLRMPASAAEYMQHACPVVKVNWR